MLCVYFVQKKTADYFTITRSERETMEKDDNISSYIKIAIYERSSTVDNAFKCWSFYKNLVHKVTGSSRYDDFSFVVTRFDDVLAFLNTKSMTTRNRYVTHILGMFDLLGDYKDQKAVAEAKMRYRDIVSETKRILRVQYRDKKLERRKTRQELLKLNEENDAKNTSNKKKRTVQKENLVNT